MCNGGSGKLKSATCFFGGAIVGSNAGKVRLKRAVIAPQRGCDGAGIVRCSLPFVALLQQHMWRILRDVRMVMGKDRRMH